MEKSRDAFRTISEVAEALGTQPHVLRFWESKFSQVKPVKRAGGRRYYRPSDVALLAGIKQLLHEDGVTIKGVQKVLRERGVKYVTALAAGGPPAELAASVVVPMAAPTPTPTPPASDAPPRETGAEPAVSPAVASGAEAGAEPELPLEPADDIPARAINALRDKAHAAAAVDPAILRPVLTRLKALKDKLGAQSGGW